MIKLFLLPLVLVKLVLSPPAWALQDEYEAEQQLRDIFSSLAHHQPLSALTGANALKRPRQND